MTDNKPDPAAGLPGIGAGFLVAESAPPTDLSLVVRLPGGRAAGYSRTSNKLILGLVGEMASGKTTVTNYLKKKYGAVTHRFSDPLRDVLARLHRPETRANLQQLSTLLRQNFGEDLLSKILAADAAADAAPLVIIEGIRRAADMIDLKKLPGFRLVALTADERKRYERLTGRRENPDDRAKSWEQFQAEGRAESEQQIKAVAKEAAATIDNNGTFAKLYRQVDALVK
ncbi:MAG: AAA family ATPase [Candidatus Magasanikbacteria bacterium]|nr:AAA family ATPase [Candidatus Magasanikbacteria bacterium]